MPIIPKSDTLGNLAPPYRMPPPFCPTWRSPNQPLCYGSLSERWAYRVSKPNMIGAELNSSSRSLRVIENGATLSSSLSILGLLSSTVLNTQHHRVLISVHILWSRGWCPILADFSLPSAGHSKALLGQQLVSLQHRWSVKYGPSRTS